MISEFNGIKPRIAESAFISETACIIGDVEIGEESSVWPGAVIRGDMGRITIGCNTSIEDNCVIHSGSPATPVCDVTIGNHVIMGHGAVSNGRSIGNHVLIGMNATILHDAEIGNYCIIAAAALVGERMKVPDHSLVVGVPGKIKGKPNEKQLWWIEEAPGSYKALIQAYKNQKS